MSQGFCCILILVNNYKEKLLINVCGVFNIDIVTWQIIIYKDIMYILANSVSYSVVENNYIGKSRWVVCEIHNDIKIHH